jgi:hypothetical protein
MQGFLEFNYTEGLFSTSTCEVGLGSFLPILDKQEASQLSTSCENPFGLNIITCKHPKKEAFTKEVNGLELDVTLSSTIQGLPYYVPIFDYGSKDVANPFPMVGITLHDIVAKGIVLKAGRLHEQNEIMFREKILLSNAFKNKKVILFLTGADTLIEWIWYNRNECAFFKTLKEMGFWAIGGFNFSVIGGECPFSHALNQKRSLYSSYLLEKEGIQTIPHVYAITNFHIKRWINWFSINPLIKLFTINCQLQKTQSDINQLCKTVREILTALPYLHVVLCGFHLSEVYKLKDCLSRVHFADKRPVKLAQNKRRIIYEKEKLGIVSDIYSSIEPMILNNIVKQSHWIENTFYESAAEK